MGKTYWGAAAIAAAAVLAATPAMAQTQTGVLAPNAAQAVPAAKPWYKQPWNASRVRPCDRECLVEIADSYLRALETKDYSRLPFAEEVAFTENTAHLDIGEGTLWRADIKPTNFIIHVADPVTGQIGVQIVYEVEGKPALVAIRLKVERRMITEVEQLIDRNVAPQAMELLQTPRPTLLNDVPAKQRSSREYLLYAANSYFDALTGEDGHIAPFADECVRHEQGYQTVNNKKPGRASPSPQLPDTSTEMGRTFSRLSTMTCEQQISTKIFTGIKKIWPRRAIIDEQKGLVAIFPLFVHDGTKRKTGGPGDNDKRLGMVLNMVTMETFGIRQDKIWEVEAFPFIIVPYGMGDGWTNARAR